MLPPNAGVAYKDINNIVSEERASMHERRHNNSDDGLCYQVATKLARSISKEMEQHSKLIQPKNEMKIPKFAHNEIILGNLLGTGGYNEVYELHGIEVLPYDYDSDGTYRDPESRERHNNKRYKIATESIDSANQNRPKYAIKFLRQSLESDIKAFCNGAADLIVETKILANLPKHRNLIQLHGVSAGGINGFSTGCEGGYFLMLDCLSDTLENRIKNEWQKRIKLPPTKTLKDNSQFFMERLHVGAEISNAVKHLHSHNIVYRDLKPDNVGFTHDGVVKIFDFGLSKELDERQKVQTRMRRRQVGAHHEDTSADEATYNMSGQTGSRRYMAPEVALNAPYNFKADVYSFGVLMYQILSLQEPFADVKTTKQYNDLVCKGGKRPSLEVIPEAEKGLWTKQLRNVISWSWYHDHRHRPAIRDVHRALKKEMHKLQETPQQQDVMRKPQTLSNSIKTSLDHLRSVKQQTAKNDHNKIANKYLQHDTSVDQLTKLLAAANTTTSGSCTCGCNTNVGKQLRTNNPLLFCKCDDKSTLSKYLKDALIDSAEKGELVHTIDHNAAA